MRFQSTNSKALCLSLKNPANGAVSAKQHCAEIEKPVQIRVELIVPELAKRNGVTEKLKVLNQLLMGTADKRLQGIGAGNGKIRVDL